MIRVGPSLLPSYALILIQDPRVRSSSRRFRSFRLVSLHIAPARLVAARFHAEARLRACVLDNGMHFSCLILDVNLG